MYHGAFFFHFIVQYTYQANLLTTFVHVVVRWNTDRVVDDINGSQGARFILIKSYFIYSRFKLISINREKYEQNGVGYIYRITKLWNFEFLQIFRKLFPNINMNLQISEVISINYVQKVNKKSNFLP